jgi:hypothetical protein
MSAWHPDSERERATAAVTRCAGQLRQAQEHARRSGEALRRALREVAETEGVLEDAARRLDRVESSTAAVEPRVVYDRIPLWRCA